MQKQLLLIIGILFLLPEISDAQRRRWNPEKRFNAGAVLGLNAAQIDGDRQSGYRKVGLSTGLRATAALSATLDLSFELLYSQKGSQPNPKKTSSESITMGLNYAEVPILLNIYTNENWEGFRPLRLQIGFSYARLLNFKIQESTSTFPGIHSPKEMERVPYSELTEYFNSNEISLVAGLSYYFSKNIGFTLRHTFAFTKLYDNADRPDLLNESLRNYYLSLQMVYML